MHRDTETHGVKLHTDSNWHKHMEQSSCTIFSAQSFGFVVNYFWGLMSNWNVYSLKTTTTRVQYIETVVRHVFISSVSSGWLYRFWLVKQAVHHGVVGAQWGSSHLSLEVSGPATRVPRKTTVGVSSSTLLTNGKKNGQTSRAVCT